LIERLGGKNNLRKKTGGTDTVEGERRADLNAERSLSHSRRGIF